VYTNTRKEDHMQSDNESKIIRITYGAWRKLRIMAADTDEKLGETVTRLVDAEWERVKILEANAARLQEAQP